MHQQVEIVLGPRQGVAIVANLHRVAALRQDVQALVVGVVRDVFRHHRRRPTTEEAVAGVLSQPSLADSGGLVGSACPLTVPWLPCTTIQINNWRYEMPGYLPLRVESGLEPALAAVILALASGPRRPRRSCGPARVPRLTWCWAGAMRGMK